jgi:hypothetical protein
MDPCDSNISSARVNKDKKKANKCYSRIYKEIHQQILRKKEKNLLERKMEEEAKPGRRKKEKRNKQRNRLKEVIFSDGFFGRPAVEADIFGAFPQFVDKLLLLLLLFSMDFSLGQINYRERERRKKLQEMWRMLRKCYQMNVIDIIRCTSFRFVTSQAFSQVMGLHLSFFCHFPFLAHQQLFK